MIRKPSVATRLAITIPVASAAAVEAAIVTRVPSPRAAPPAAARKYTAQSRPAAPSRPEIRDAAGPPITIITGNVVCTNPCANASRTVFQRTSRSRSVPIDAVSIVGRILEGCRHGAGRPAQLPYRPPPDPAQR